MSKDPNHPNYKRRIPNNIHMKETQQEGKHSSLHLEFPVLTEISWDG